MAILPLFLALAVPLVLILASFIKRSFYKFWTLYMNSLIVAWYLVYPAVTELILQNFHCVDLMGQTVLSMDTDTQCYQGSHLTSIYAVSIPALALWTLGMPLMAALGIRSNSRSGSDSSIKSSSFVLSTGLNLKYWEVLTLLRKAALISVIALL